MEAAEMMTKAADEIDAELVSLTGPKYAELKREARDTLQQLRAIAFYIQLAHDKG